MSHKAYYGKLHCTTNICEHTWRLLVCQQMSAVMSVAGPPVHLVSTWRCNAERYVGGTVDAVAVLRWQASVAAGCMAVSG